MRVSNATPGGTLILFTVGIANEGGMLRQSTGAKAFSDSDGDGVIVFTSSRRIPLRSVWVAIDLQAGTYTIGTPPEYKANVVPLSKDVLKQETGGIFSLSGVDQLSADILIIRPREGAWRVRTYDGANSDNDKVRNGKVSLSMLDALAIPGTKAPPPKSLAPGDILIVIDPARLDVAIAEIGK